MIYPGRHGEGIFVFKVYRVKTSPKLIKMYKYSIGIYYSRSELELLLALATATQL
jgi:hypothetical protein